jgi:hypothetical protein
MEESGAWFVPVVWFTYSRNAAQLDNVSQANGNETLVLCSAVDDTPALCTNFTRHRLVEAHAVDVVVGQCWKQATSEKRVRWNGHR